MTKNKLLWVDDDYKKGRFTYEEEVITEDLNWTLTWAESLEEAARLLSTESFDALLLDQQFYVHEADAEFHWTSSEKNIPWQGITLLYWLRNDADSDREKNKLANHSMEYVTSSLVELRQNVMPLDKNKSLPVLVLSAFYHDDILTALRDASNHDSDLDIHSKPVDISEIEAFLGAVGDEKNG
jgi:hypothetical protein